MDLSWNQLKRSVKDTETYMMIGNGSKQQFRDLRVIRGAVHSISNEIPSNANLLYFGDYPNRKKPDIGYAFQMLTELRPDIQVFMIQISEAKSWGHPKFVNGGIYWHSDYSKSCKWGGVHNGEPCSNTKKWVNLHT